MNQLELFNYTDNDIWAEEKKLFKQGFHFVGGIDEAGRGPLAGPVVAAIVVSKKIVNIPGVTDSKKLTSKKRIELKTIIETHHDLKFGLGIVSPKLIDKLNILQASLFAFKKALDDVSIKPDYCLVDGNKKSPFISLPQKALVKGDSRSFLIAAASILAKETRDALMIKYDKKWPEYGFAKHKGYPTKVHRIALKKYGITKIHRKTFEPVKSLLNSC